MQDSRPDPGRYTGLALPAYRFRRGTNPHPSASPEGHGNRYIPEPDAAATAPERWRENRTYLYGCDLYNHGYWWEAHEAWEDLWHLTGHSGTQAAYFKGLIQAAACALKVELGNLAGACTLIARSEAYLQRVTDEVDGPVYMGLDIPGWLDYLRTYYDAPLEERTAGHDPGAFPYIVLRH